MFKSFLQWLNNYSLLKSSLTIVTSSLIASTVTLAVRQLGGFESFSLSTYDWLVQLHSDESVDSRLLTVLITLYSAHNRSTVHLFSSAAFFSSSILRLNQVIAN